MNEQLYAVIMAGGIGSRLWPRSRATSPKQFLDLTGPRTMLQETVDRIQPLIPLERLLVVVGQDHVAAVRAQIPSLPEENVLVEPGPRGTAPCIGLAAVALRQRDPQATMAVFPADHLIMDASAFRRAIAAAARVAQQGYLVTLGITPSHPHTGYGYIQRGHPLGEVAGLPAFEVQRFAEKPDAPTAQAFVESGEYFWNGGIFVWRAASILSEMERLLPRLHMELQTLALNWKAPEFPDILAAAWEQVPRTTIDYGVMEQAQCVAVLPIDVGWDDVGNWANLAGLVDSDENGNARRGAGHHLLVETSDTYVYTTAGRLVVLVGVEGFIVIDTPDALLVCRKDHAQGVRDVVDRLEENGLERYL